MFKLISTGSNKPWESSAYQLALKNFQRLGNVPFSSRFILQKMEFKSTSTLYERMLVWRRQLNELKKKAKNAPPHLKVLAKSQAESFRIRAMRRILYLKNLAPFFNYFSSPTADKRLSDTLNALVTPDVYQKITSAWQKFFNGEDGHFSAPSPFHERDNQDFALKSEKIMSKTFSGKVQFKIRLVHIVCDGATGHHKSGPGAEIVTKAFMSTINEWKLGGKIDTIEHLKDCVYDFFAVANKTVNDWHIGGINNRINTATVSVVLQFQGKQILFSFNVGDCETVVLFKNKNPMYMTPPFKYMNQDEILCSFTLPKHKVHRAAIFQEKKYCEVRDTSGRCPVFGFKNPPNFTLTVYDLPMVNAENFVILTFSDGVGDAFCFPAQIWHDRWYDRWQKRWRDHKSYYLFRDLEWTHKIYENVYKIVSEKGCDAATRFYGYLSLFAAAKSEDDGTLLLSDRNSIFK